jgi:SAM-dependent methyltransferase
LHRRARLHREAGRREVSPARLLPHGFLCGVLLAVSAVAPLCAQPQARRNLDVPYVPTNQATVEAMLQIAGVGPSDFVIDLGSGDGRILITAARLRGARGFGVDLDAQRVKEATENARAAGVAERVQFYQRNLFDTRIAEASVVTLYLLPRINVELRPRLLAELRPGTRVVSHDFDMGDWHADLRVSAHRANSEIHYWVIPAQVGGRWQVLSPALRGVQGYEIEFRQKYQEIEAVTKGLERPMAVRDARLVGDRIQFTLVDDGDIAHRVRFEGRVGGAVMEGTVRGDGTAPRGAQKWRATRAQP